MLVLNVEWLKVSGICCTHAATQVQASLRPALDLIILLLNDLLSWSTSCPSCGKDIRTGAFVGHKHGRPKGGGGGMPPPSPLRD